MGFETVGTNGGESYQTPHLDQMAAQGIRFEHCYSQPLCTPSRVQIMTGIYNVRNYVRFGFLDTTQTTFGHLFKEAGYATCVVGKWQLGKDPMSPQKAGFDEHCLWQLEKTNVDSLRRDTRYSKPVLEMKNKTKTYEDHDYGPEVVSNYGMDFMERMTEKQQPFLLYYPMILPHCPFSPSPDSEEWISDRKAVMTYKGNAAYFEDMVAYVDKIVGKINQHLEALGIDDNTMIIFTGDNGTDRPVVSKWRGREVAGAKRNSTNGGTHVPLIAKWKGVIPSGQLSNDLVDFSDILPTICDAALLQVPDSLDIDGHSFLPQCKGEKGNPRKWTYNWFSRSGKVEEAKVFARNQGYKLYTNGEFFNVPNDLLEKSPLAFEELNVEEKAIYEMLKGVLESYEGRRLEDVK